MTFTPYVKISFTAPKDLIEALVSNIELEGFEVHTCGSDIFVLGSDIERIQSSVLDYYERRENLRWKIT